MRRVFGRFSGQSHLALRPRGVRRVFDAVAVSAETVSRVSRGRGTRHGPRAGPTIGFHRGEASGRHGRRRRSGRLQKPPSRVERPTPQSRQQTPHRATTAKPARAQRRPRPLHRRAAPRHPTALRTQQRRVVLATTTAASATPVLQLLRHRPRLQHQQTSQQQHQRHRPRQLNKKPSFLEEQLLLLLCLLCFVVFYLRSFVRARSDRLLCGGLCGPTGGLRLHGACCSFLLPCTSSPLALCCD
mmetsp:Transcript_872/g.2452  ORF Transcript_872/g.2452 Transcript_872/m.2452 type:complete len:243 (+) Transcript_872:511-1239(+)